MICEIFWWQDILRNSGQLDQCTIYSAWTQRKIGITFSLKQYNLQSSDKCLEISEQIMGQMINTEHKLISNFDYASIDWLMIFSFIWFETQWLNIFTHICYRHSWGHKLIAKKFDINLSSITTFFAIFNLQMISPYILFESDFSPHYFSLKST